MKTELDDFVLEHTPFVWRVLTHLGLRRESLEDACQEVFVAALRGLASFEQRSSQRTWLYGICRNVALSERRRYRVLTEIPMEDLPETVIQPAQEGALWVKRAHERLIQALSHLEESQRLIFILYEIEGLAMQEIASELGAPLRTCYSRLHAARQRVHSELRRSELRTNTPGRARND